MARRRFRFLNVLRMVKALGSSLVNHSLEEYGHRLLGANMREGLRWRSVQHQTTA